MALDLNEIRNRIREMWQLALDSVNCLNHFCRPLVGCSNVDLSITSMPMDAGQLHTYTYILLKPHRQGLLSITSDTKTLKRT